MSKRKREAREFQFEISLSVLNHLGRNLYRNFITVLGEAISNAWDADATSVYIDIDREKSYFRIVDHGIGMTANDFQNKFLKIGYSKRSKGKYKSQSDRPFIGAKGIGKLALLSCAKRISVFSRTKRGNYVGGVIDNSGLDAAIRHDLTPDQYSLEQLDFELIADLADDHKNGTIIVFEDFKEPLRNSIPYLKKLLAMTFRFSIIDDDFAIFANDEKITVDDLSDLISATEFLWTINEFSDDYTDKLSKLKADPLAITTPLDIAAFLATVEKPRHLNVAGTDARATVDLFVNGRLREKHILRHIPTQRILESYLYGQIHFDAMDQGETDPSTSSRKGVLEDIPNMQSLLDFLRREAIPLILDKWDELRVSRGSEGDDENPRRTKKERKARDLYSAAREEYAPEDESPRKDVVDEWMNGLQDDAEFNLSAYVDCFLSENLLRKYIGEHNIKLPDTAAKEIKVWREREGKRKGEANISYTIRKGSDGYSYLGMNFLAEIAEGKGAKGKNRSLWKDTILYKPVRNVVGHTGLLTTTAKSHLHVTHENIKARVKDLILERRARKK